VPDHEIFVDQLRLEFGLGARGDRAAIFDNLFKTDSSYLGNMPITGPLSARGVP
jgi:hypothetical protein